MNVRQTSSGVLVKVDSTLGLLVFSPYSGLVFAVVDEDRTRVLDWLDQVPDADPVEDAYRAALGWGWLDTDRPGPFPHRHLLPTSAGFQQITTPSDPILVNWFITGNCQFRCAYCYAEDLMRGRITEPTKDRIVSTARSILRLNPIVVVLTGGEPLSSPYLETALTCLSGKTGIVVDTNGLLLEQHHLDLFRQHQVVVRVSLDSERPVSNGKYRGVSDPLKSPIEEKWRVTQASVRALDRCLGAGLPVAVQTVGTKEALTCLPELGEKLVRLGVVSWRIHRVAPSSCSMPGYSIARPSATSYEHYISGLASARERRWSSRIAVDFASNDVRNSVLLVAPNGVFYTESNNPDRPGKVVVDEKRPRTPTLKALRRKLDMSAHAARYLNIR